MELDKKLKELLFRKIKLFLKENLLGTRTINLISLKVKDRKPSKSGMKVSLKWVDYFKDHLVMEQIIWAEELEFGIKEFLYLRTKLFHKVNLKVILLIQLIIFKIEEKEINSLSLRAS